MTAKEREERDYKKQLLQIAKEHEKARELERIQRYHIPQNLKKGEKGKIFVELYFYALLNISDNFQRNMSKLMSWKNNLIRNRKNGKLNS